MKTILTLLLIAVGIYAAWLQQTAKEAASLAEARITEVNNELRDTKAELKETQKALGKADKEPVSKPKASTASRSGANVATVETASTAEPAPADEGPSLSDRLAELRGIYEGHRKKFDDQRAALTKNLAAARAQKSTLESNPPLFNEQGSRFDGMGNRVGATGVRTSKSDREREISKHAEQVASVSAIVVAAEAELVKVESEVARLDRSYDDAIEKARSEARQR